MAEQLNITNVVNFPIYAHHGPWGREMVEYFRLKRESHEAHSSENEGLARQLNTVALAHMHKAIELAQNPAPSFVAHWRRRKRLPGNLVDLAAVRAEREQVSKAA